MYAASNAFPLDTKVVISRPGDGSVLEVRVVERLEKERIFMQLSPQAAEKLGLQKNEIITARVYPVPSSGGMVEGQIALDAPLSGDPDIKPSAGLEEERLSLIEEYLALEGLSMDEAPDGGKAGGSEIETVGTPESTGQAEPGESTEIVDGGEPEEYAEPALSAISSMPERSLPEEDLSVVLPPPARPEELREVREDGRDGSSAELAQVPEDSLLEETEIEEAPAVPTVVAIEPLFLTEKDRSYSPSAPVPPEIEPEKGAPRVSMLRLEPENASAEAALGDEVRHFPQVREKPEPTADLRTAEAEIPEESIEDAVPIIVDAGPERPEEIPEDAELVLIPAEERPPLGPPERERTQQGEKGAAATAEEADAGVDKIVEAGVEEQIRDDRLAADTPSANTGTLTFSEKLEKSSFYLQVAAYNKLDLARARGEGLASRYPVTIYSDRKGTAPYKLMIGPLNEDESGTLLFTFNSLGYPDAFIRRGN
jgi:hypothetical protein